MITETILTRPLAKLFMGYAKAVILSDIKNRIEKRLNLVGEVTTPPQRCYGDLMGYSWETLKFYIKDIDTLFSINIGFDSGRNEENFNKDVIFIEVNIYKGNNDGDIIYNEIDNIDLWEYMLNDFYHKLTQYFNLNFEQ